MEDSADKLYEDIESWLDGRMDREAAEAFAGKLEKDEALRDLVEQHQLARGVIDEWIADDYQSRINIWKQELPEQSAAKLSWKKYFFWSIPLILSLGILFWFLNSRQQPAEPGGPQDQHQPEPAIEPVVKDTGTLPEPGSGPGKQNEKSQDTAPPIFANPSGQTPAPEKKATNPVPTPNESALVAIAEAQLDTYDDNMDKRYAVTRGDESSSPAAFEKGRKAFIAKDYVEAKQQLLIATKATDQYTTDAMELLAIIYYREQDYHRAAEIFGQLAPKKRGEDTDWRLTMFYLADFNNQQNKFKLLLDRISTTQGHKYQLKAQELKKELFEKGVLRSGE
jgi:TolA-binding protein